MSGSPGQLYDIKNDPFEQHNLWDERPKLVAELKDLIETYKEKGRTKS